MSVPRLQVQGLTKSFFGVTVLHGLDFEAAPGDVLGLVGENGSGKSTAMNILAGVVPRDAGRILLDGKEYLPHSRREADAAGIAFIQQELSIFPNLTVAENLFLGHLPRVVAGLPFISRTNMRARARESLQTVGLELDPDMRTEALSPGERQLVEIARGLSSNARVMIFDEPTTSLTRQETERLFGLIQRLKEQGITIVFISHALEDVLRLSDQIIVLRDGKVTRSLAKTMATTQELVLAMVGRSIEALFPDRPYRESRQLSPVLEVKNLEQPGVVTGIEFNIGAGEIVGLAGLMGSGRTELARIVFGLDPHSGGAIRMRGRALRPGCLHERIDAGMAFLTEDRRVEGLMMEASVASNMALAALPLFTTGAHRKVEDDRMDEAMRLLSTRLKIKSGPPHATAVRLLSGGNQQKVVMGRWLLRQPSIFILDEPTRGVDVGAKEEIYRILAELADRGAGVLVISSELEELIGLSDRILVMHRGRLRGQFHRKDFDSEQILRAAFGQERAT